MIDSPEPEPSAQHLDAEQTTAQLTPATPVALLPTAPMVPKHAFHGLGRPLIDIVDGVDAPVPVHRSYVRSQIR